MDFVIALMPSLLYGSLGIVIGKIGGDNRQQTVGQLSGAFIVAAVLAMFAGVNLPAKDMAIAFAAGIVVAIAIQYQLKAFQSIGVSRVMPLTTGGQLVAIALLGVLLFGEWIGTAALPVGLLAVALVVAGVALSAYTERVPSMPLDGPLTEGVAMMPAPSIIPTTGSQPIIKVEESGGSLSSGSTINWKRGLWETALSTVGFVVFIIGLRYFDVDPVQSFFPQACGFLLTGLIVTLPKLSPGLGPSTTQFSRTTTKMLIPGMMWGLGIVLMQYSQVNVGVAVGFTLSQLGVVISTFGGILILKERRTKKEMKVVIIGVILLIVGAILLGVAKSLDVA